MASSLLMKPTITSSRDEVYVAAVPLRATKGPAQLLTSNAYSLNLWGLQHFMVIVKPSSPPQPHSQALVFGFQPKDPENIYTALAVLSGKEIPGIIRTRKMSKLPRCRCWFVGSSKAGAIDIASEFNKVWETHLRVGHHDCRNDTNGMKIEIYYQNNYFLKCREVVQYMARVRYGIDNLYLLHSSYEFG